MFKIVCPSCKAENKFQSRDNTPIECSFCWESIPQDTQIIGNEDSREIIGLTIIYQITQQRIEISTLHRTVLGRENFGANVFSKIFFNGKPVVSRKHCSIEFKGGNFYLLDEGSLNGTFYGINKLSCKNSPQVIEDKSIFYIGEEAFLAQINYEEQKQETIQHTEIENKKEAKAIKLYRCNDQNCSGYESPSPFDVCPSCGAFKNIIPVYE